MTPTGKLTLDFAMRMINDLESNNVLRGSWAEHLVAHYLAIDYTEMPPNWSYFDMRYPTPSGALLGIPVTPVGDDAVPESELDSEDASD